MPTEPIPTDVLDEVERALMSAPIPSKFGAGLGEYVRLAEEIHRWKGDLLLPALARLRAAREGK